ncbi:MAG: ABC transporter ATP-binding protein [Clostridiales bacterium]|jgi:ATP-binding cassette subfamily B protein|nr:ABC transporter ATP-binding protein [Clostridiales bacterium]
MNSYDESNSIFRRLFSYAKPYRGFLIAALISSLISVTLSLLIPIYIGKAVDYIIGPGDVNYQGVLDIIIYLAVFIGGSTVFQWLMSYSTNKITFLTIKDLRSRVFDKLNIVPFENIDRTPHGNIINTMVNDIDIISDGLLQGFTQLFSGLMTILGTIGFMLSINLGIGILVVVLTPLSLFVASSIARRTYSKFTEQTQIRGEMGGLIEELLGNQKLVKTYSYEDRAYERFKEVNDRLHKVGVMAQFYSSLTNPSTRFVNGIVYAAVGILGAFSAISGNISIGQLTSFLSYANQYTKPFNEISGVITELQSALASAKRVFALIDMEAESSDEELISQVESDGRVKLTDVAFSYVKDKPLIEGLNIDVKPGSRIAIVGPTGSGKTTVINLLMRFYDVDQGKIEVSGVDVLDMQRKALRSMYGMVLQETWLFEGTVRENIAYGKENVSEEEIMDAAKAAYAHSFIKRLPNGYDTIITQDGGNLSQGQRQLLSIARVMLLKPPMLILDEATSNIDTRTEIRIQKAFAKLMKGRTSFVVAHRLSTIRESDTILVMDQGSIIEQGNHEELLSKEGFYHNLYNSQFHITRA